MKYSTEELHYLSSIISKFTTIECSKVAFFIRKFGLKTIFNDPALITGLTKKQETLMKDLKKIVLTKGNLNKNSHLDNKNPTVNIEKSR